MNIKKLIKYIAVLSISFVLQSAYAIKIGITLPTQNISRWYFDGKEMEAFLIKNGHDVQLYYGGDGDVELQKNQIERMISDGCQMIVVAPIDSKAFIKELEKAHKAGITVVSYDLMLTESENVDYFITFDSERIGAEQAFYLLDALEINKNPGTTPKNIEIFAGSTKDQNAKLMWQGVRNVLKPYLDKKDLNISSNAVSMGYASIADNSEDKAYKRMLYLIEKQNYGVSKDKVHLDAIISPSESITLGIVKALKKSGFAEYEYPYIISADLDIASEMCIYKRQIDMGVYKDYKALHKALLSIANAKSQNKVVKLEDNDTYYNGAKYLATLTCESIPVTLDNISTVIKSNNRIENFVALSSKNF